MRNGQLLAKSLESNNRVVFDRAWDSMPSFIGGRYANSFETKSNIHFHITHDSCFAIACICSIARLGSFQDKFDELGWLFSIISMDWAGKLCIDAQEQRSLDVAEKQCCIFHFASYYDSR